MVAAKDFGDSAAYSLCCFCVCIYWRCRKVFVTVSALCSHFFNGLKHFFQLHYRDWWTCCAVFHYVMKFRTGPHPFSYVFHVYLFLCYSYNLGVDHLRADIFMV